MSEFTIRVVLHGNAGWMDYQKLHAQMVATGFSRTLFSDKGVEYHMPDAEYNRVSAESPAQVRDLAVACASKTGHQCSVMVTQSVGRTWWNLEKVQPASVSLNALLDGSLAVRSTVLSGLLRKA